MIYTLFLIELCSCVYHVIYLMYAYMFYVRGSRAFKTPYVRGSRAFKTSYVRGSRAFKTPNVLKLIFNASYFMIAKMLIFQKDIVKRTMHTLNMRI